MRPDGSQTEVDTEDFDLARQMWCSLMRAAAKAADEGDAASTLRFARALQLLSGVTDAP